MWTVICHIITDLIISLDTIQCRASSATSTFLSSVTDLVWETTTVSYEQTEKPTDDHDNIRLAHAPLPIYSHHQHNSSTKNLQLYIFLIQTRDVFYKRYL